MRALKVVGLNEDGDSVVCEHPESGERFQITADDRLRAAARGDITRLGQMQIELESQMRPREIQSRIRGGESVDDVASSAGVDIQRVERFAHPVLLERSRNAELAQQAHPVREDGPDVRTLGEVVAHAFGVRGQDYTKAAWDAWRGKDGDWVVELHWTAGRSDIRAHWVFTPGAHGGTVVPADEHAEEMLNPHAHRAPRNLRSIGTGNETVHAEETEQPTLESAGHSGELVYHADYGELPATSTAEHATVIDAALPAELADETADEAADETVGEDTTEFPTVTGEAEHETQNQAATADPRKKHHPVVPAWEDVLLGVRSQRGS